MTQWGSNINTEMVYSIVDVFECDGVLGIQSQIGELAKFSVKIVLS